MRIDIVVLKCFKYRCSNMFCDMADWLALKINYSCPQCGSKDIYRIYE